MISGLGLIGINLNAYSQELTSEQKEKITLEITKALEKRIQTAEYLDANM